MWVAMSAARREEFLAGVHVGVLSVAVGKAGHTLAVPVWYSYQPGGLLTVLTGRRSRKAAAIRTAGRFGLCAQDDSPPYRYVNVEGPVVGEEELDPAERLAMARRYLGSPGGDRYIADNPDPGRENMAFRMRPEHWLSQDQGTPAVSPGAAEVPTEPAQAIPASLADLLERPLYGHLATVRPDGTPQVNPTWFRFDGEYLWLTTTTWRQKNRNWQVQPAVALSITDPDRPSRYLEIRGRVERIIPDPQGAEFVRLAERYAMPQGPPPDAADRIAVAIRPQHTTTQ